MGGNGSKSGLGRSAGAATASMTYKTYKVNFTDADELMGRGVEGGGNRGLDEWVIFSGKK